VLSRLATGELAEEKPEEYAGQLTAYVLAMQSHTEALTNKRPEIEQCLAEEFMETEMSMFPMSPKIIANEQGKDKELQESLGKSPDAYEKHILEGCELVMHANQIVIPKTLQQRIVEWYHHYLAHPGQTHMEVTLRQLYTWPTLR